MSDKVRAYAAVNQGDQLKPFEYDPGALGPDQVEIAVEYCGLCHSDLSMYDNEWGMTDYPFVPGHEVIGKISATGERVEARRVGQRVGLGWFSGSCMSCHHCLSGDHNLCSDPVRNESTIVHRHGGFADRVRAHWIWTQPIPDVLDFKKAGPLFCGGITVFNPIIQNNVKPTDRVGVIGIGGLGHLALAFLNKWGCEVTAFTSSNSKHEEALKLGAHKVVNTRDKEALRKIAGSLNFVLSTVNATLDWQSYIESLAPKGRFVTVGIVTDPVQLGAFPLIAGQKSFGGSPLGSPSTVEKMTDFCARHSISPVTENFKLSEVNDAFDHLRAGKARYRIVLAKTSSNSSYTICRPGAGQSPATIILPGTKHRLEAYAVWASVEVTSGWILPRRGYRTQPRVEWREDKGRFGLVLARKGPSGFSPFSPPTPRHRLEAYATLTLRSMEGCPKKHLPGGPRTNGNHATG